MAKRKRRLFSVKAELLMKSREAALAAVQIFNSPTLTFKSEIFIVLMNIAWTYLLHAYYRSQGLEYRYFDLQGTRRIFGRTKNGALKFWELERCLNEDTCPIDKDSANNLRFLIGIRHEIEHQMTSRIDDSLSAKFQACCLNYNEYVKSLFGEQNGIDRHLSLSLQFSSISRDQVGALTNKPELPAHIKGFVESFESQLSEPEYNNPKFSFRVLFIAKTANHKGQADEVIEFVKMDSELAQKVNASYALIKETERAKHLPTGIVASMKAMGFTKFTPNAHANLWKSLNAKDPSKGYGVQVINAWYWYDRWLTVVLKHCEENRAKYT